MQEVQINYLALLVAVVVKMILGAVWYSPLLFVKPWIKLVGQTEKSMKAGMAKALTIELIGTLLMAFVLVHAIRYAGAKDVVQGLMVAFWNWLGFMAVVTIGSVTYEKRPFKLFLINNGYLLASMLIMGVILAVWV